MSLFSIGQEQLGGPDAQLAPTWQRSAIEHWLRRVQVGVPRCRRKVKNRQAVLAAQAAWQARAVSTLGRSRVFAGVGRQ
jgi:hypothetical protein